MEYSNDIQDVYKNIEEYNLRKKQKALIVFDDMVMEWLVMKNSFSSNWTIY